MSAIDPVLFANPDPSFHCLACRRTFDSVRKWVCHVVAEHDSKAAVFFECCESQFTTFRPAWLEHLHTVHRRGDHPLPCTERSCSQTFQKLAELRSHRKEHHEKKIVRCECHSLFFSTRGRLQQHLRRQARNVANPISSPSNMQAAAGDHLSDRGRLQREPKRRRRGDHPLAQQRLHDAAERSPERTSNTCSPPAMTAAAAAAAPRAHSLHSNPGYLALHPDLRNLVGGVCTMRGATAHEAIFPFLSLLTKLPPVREIVGDSDGDIDATAPLHWATKDHLPLSGTKLFELVLADMNSGRSAKFRSGHLVDPVEGSSSAVLNARVLSHMIVPDPDSAELMYAANIDGQSKDFQVRVPGALYLHRHFDAEEVAGKYSSNMTPQGTVVDLHRDRMDVFSVCSDWKLWVFFPPTPHNLSLLEHSVKYTKRLLRLHDKLEEGRYAIVGEDEACYIPAGYLHATYSLKSSCTVGNSWSSAEALAAAVDMLVAELRPNAEVRVAMQHDLYYFLRSLVQAFHCEMYETCRDAMQEICWMKLNVLGKRGALLGPGWGLKATTSRKSIAALVQSVREAVVGSGRSEEFWLCNKGGCGSVIDHI